MNKRGFTYNETRLKIKYEPFRDRFGGSPEIDNLVSQSSSVNLSEYKKIENQWAKAISEGKKVTTNVEILYDGDSLRPKGFKVRYTIDGVAYSKRILN